MIVVSVGICRPSRRMHDNRITTICCCQRSQDHKILFSCETFSRFVSRRENPARNADIRRLEPVFSLPSLEDILMFAQFFISICYTQNRGGSRRRAALTVRRNGRCPMDFSLFAELFYNANYLPSLTLKDGAPEAYFGSAPARKLLLAAVDMFDTSSGCSQIVSSGEALYAYIPQKSSPFALVIGPAAFTQSGARKRWDALTAREEEELLSSLPKTKTMIQRYKNLFLCF